jgi:hypothetical protein
MAQFRKKPVVIEAMLWDGTSVADLREFFGAFSEWGLAECEYVEIRTLEGTMTANPGDWIIKGLKGEFYPCKPEVFQISYDAVELAEREKEHSK